MRREIGRIFFKGAARFHLTLSRVPYLAAKMFLLRDQLGILTEAFSDESRMRASHPTRRSTLSVTIFTVHWLNRNDRRTPDNLYRHLVIQPLLHQIELLRFAGRAASPSTPPTAAAAATPFRILR